MRILYIGNWVRHGKFCSDEFKAARGFELERHEVRQVKYSRRGDLSAGGLVHDGLLPWTPDVAVWTKLSGGICPLDLSRVDTIHNCPQVMWHWDLCTDRSNFGWFWKCLPEFDLFCHTERCRFEEWEKAYGTPCRYLDNACDPEYHKAQGTPRPEWECDVGFIGDAHGLGQRRALMQRLAKDFSVRAWSPFPTAWTRMDIPCDGPVYGDDIADACASAKIMLGSSATTDCEGYWSNRIYTVMGSGGFFLTEYVPGLCDIVSPWSLSGPAHCDVFTTNHECMAIVKYWLRGSLHSSELRNDVATRGCNHIRTNHTWQHRARQMIAYLEELNLI